MSQGLRVPLRILQVLALLGALLYLAMLHLEAYADVGLSEDERQFAPMWAVTLAVLSVAFSPSLWSLRRDAAGAGAAPAAPGSHDRVAEPPAASQRPGGVGFEPMNPSGAPAPPASSYGQPSGPGFGAQPSAGGAAPAPPQQGESPWGSR